MRDTIRLVPLPLLLVAAMGAESPASSQERRFEVAFQIANVSQSELESNDVGFGGRFGVRVTDLLDVEGELNFFSADIPEDVGASGSRLEGLFGARVGPKFDRLGVFGKARAGFVRFGEAPEPFVCIAIFPPPLVCVLGSGHTSPALDIGGGVELYPSPSTTLRVDVSNLLIRYPGPAFDRDREALSEDFWRGNLRVSVGLGFRF